MGRARRRKIEGLVWQCRLKKSFRVLHYHSFKKSFATLKKKIAAAVAPKRQSRFFIKKNISKLFLKFLSALTCRAPPLSFLA